MKYSVDDAVKTAFLAVAGFFRAPVLELRVTDSNVVQIYKDRISNLSSDYDKLKDQYEALGRKYANECQINIRLNDELKELRLKK